MRYCCIAAMVLVLGVGWLSSVGQARASELQSLVGAWQFQLDPGKIGDAQRWFEREFPHTAQLPGTTDEAKLGLQEQAKPTLIGAVSRERLRRASLVPTHDQRPPVVARKTCNAAVGTGALGDAGVDR